MIPHSASFVEEGKFTNLKNIVRVETEKRNIKSGKIETSTRYFLSSLEANAKAHLVIVRGHWGIENGLHWQLDTTMKEDSSRIRTRGSAIIMAVIRKICLNILKILNDGKDALKVTAMKLSTKNKQREAIVRALAI